MYAEPKWGSGERLVPIADYRTEIAYRLRRPVEPRLLVRYYARRFSGWSERVEHIDCRTLGLRHGCGALQATFRGDDATVVVDAAEYLRVPHSLKGYGLYVSQ